MKAVRWHGKNDVRVDDVEEPTIIDHQDAILKITSTAICGSDLHIYNGLLSAMKSGDILGHEFMGEVVEVGKDVKKLKKGDRVVVPFTISCGNCFFCKKELFSCCDKSNPKPKMAEKLLGQATAGMFGYSDMMGGFPGGQAEYVNVPFADVGPIKIPENLSDEQVLFLSDIFPTGYMAAENCDIKKGETVAVWGCGPVGQFAIQSAWMLGAGKVIAIDRIIERLELARKYGKAEIINEEKEDVYEKLMQMTDGRGPDCCIDAVGTEAHVDTFDSVIDKVKQMTIPGMDRAHVLREAIRCCRKGGKLSVPGAYLGSADNIPIGAIMNKSLTLKTGQTHVQHYLPKLLQKIAEGEIDPSFIITHRINLNDAPQAYKMFNDKKDGCIKVVMSP